MSEELGRQMGKAWATWIMNQYAALNTDYQTRVKFLSAEEQRKWHEENK